MKAPTIFVGHGSPMNAIEQNKYSKTWQEIGKKFSPKGIVMVSAHWFTKGLKTQDEPHPKKIDDMYGFPKALYDLKYPAPGNKQLTNEIISALGSDANVDNAWGIDHGAWSVLVHMYPKADVPVVQLSVDATRTPAQQFAVGQKIAHLRQQGYMVIGSGNVVHAIYDADPSRAEPFDWAVAFDDYIENAIITHDFEKCIDYKTMQMAAQKSVPMPDHFYPLLTVLGAVDDDDYVSVFNKYYFAGGLSMTGYVFE